MADEMNGSLPEKRKKYRFLLSSFTQEERNELTRSIKELGGVCVDTPHYIATATHIVCKKPNRGEKYLCGSAAGKWILRQEFIKDSKKAHKWLNEEDYEWNNKCSYKGIPEGHISAPSRWRRVISQSQSGPFHGWKALIILTDPKKRNAYRSLLEVGQATVLSGKAPFADSFIQKTTHVFVAKSLENEVKCFADAGIPCLSPDYIPECILQDPTPLIDDYLISKFDDCTSNSSKPKRELPSRHITPMFPAGESGVPKTKSRLTDSVLKPGSQKRQVTVISDENHPSLPKRQKQIKSTDEVFPNWLEWHSGNPLLNNIDMSVCPVKPRNSKASKGASVFPPHVVHAIDGYLEEEGHEKQALSVITSLLSSTRYPPAILVSTVMNRLLLNASSSQLANKANTVLHRLLTLHPPPVRATLYYQAICSPTISLDTQTKWNTTAWEYFSMVYSQSLGLTNGNETNAPLRQTRDNSLMLMDFLYCVLEKDFCSYMESKESNLQDADKLKKTLIWKMFWPEGYGLIINCAIRSLLKLTWLSASQCHQDSSTFPVLHSLQGIVAMVAACFKSVDQSMVQDDNGVSPRMMTLATELALTCGRIHKDEEGLRTLLQSLRPTWLKVQMLDIILRSYNDTLVPIQSKVLLGEELSVEKIISCYFYLLPMEQLSNEDECVEVPFDAPKTSSDTTRNTVLTLITDANRYHDAMEQTNKGPEKPKKSTLDRRNIRGETPLHVAAIKNDPVKIKALIDAGADVNITDNAGWTPLHEACNHGNIKCVEEILKVRPLLYNPKQKQGSAGLDILSSPLCGTTPLHDAVHNNHIEVAQALVSAGGLPLLQAKTSKGETPADLSTSAEMINYLKTAEKNLINLSSDMSSESTETRKQQRLLTENTYLKILGRKGCNNSKHISPEKAQEYMLLLSQLLLGCRMLECDTLDKDSLKFKEQSAITICDHVDNLKHHLQAITLGSQLTPSCASRLENMKFVY